MITSNAALPNHKVIVPAGLLVVSRCGCYTLYDVTVGGAAGQKKGRVGSPLGNGPGSVKDVPGPGERLYLKSGLPLRMPGL
jgi:hypothetical protein